MLLAFVLWAVPCFSVVDVLVVAAFWSHTNKTTSSSGRAGDIPRENKTKQNRTQTRDKCVNWKARITKERIK